jgi:hypothetical protein
VIERTPELKAGSGEISGGELQRGLHNAGLFFEVKGCGENYEAAFKQAESRK